MGKKISKNKKIIFVVIILVLVALFSFIVVTSDIKRYEEMEDIFFEFQDLEYKLMDCRLHNGYDRRSCDSEYCIMKLNFCNAHESFMEKEKYLKDLTFCKVDYICQGI